MKINSSLGLGKLPNESFLSSLTISSLKIWVDFRKKWQKTKFLSFSSLSKE